MNMQSASSIWSNLLNYYQMTRSISSKLFVIASGEAKVYGSSYYWNFRTSSFKQVACLILLHETPHTWNMTWHIFWRHWRMMSKVRKRTSTLEIRKHENKRYKYIFNTVGICIWEKKTMVKSVIYLLFSYHTGYIMWHSRLRVCI